MWCRCRKFGLCFRLCTFVLVIQPCLVKIMLHHVTLVSKLWLFNLVTCNISYLSRVQIGPSPKNRNGKHRRGQIWMKMPLRNGWKGQKQLRLRWWNNPTCWMFRSVFVLDWVLKKISLFVWGSLLKIRNVKQGSRDFPYNGASFGLVM